MSAESTEPTTFARTLDANNPADAGMAVVALARADGFVVVDVLEVREVYPPAPSSRTARYRVELAVERA